MNKQRCDAAIVDVLEALHSEQNNIALLDTLEVLAFPFAAAIVGFSDRDKGEAMRWFLEELLPAAMKRAASVNWPRKEAA